MKTRSDGIKLFSLSIEKVLEWFLKMCGNHVPTQNNQQDNSSLIMGSCVVNSLSSFFSRYAQARPWDRQGCLRGRLLVHPLVGPHYRGQKTGREVGGSPWWEALEWLGTRVLLHHLVRFGEKKFERRSVHCIRFVADSDVMLLAVSLLIRASLTFTGQWLTGITAVTVQISPRCSWSWRRCRETCTLRWR